MIYGRTATKGSIDRALPGYPVHISVELRGISVLQSPSRRDGWKRLVLRSNVELPNQKIAIRWQRR